MPRVTHHPSIIYFTAAIVSLLLSFWISGTSFVLNNDGVCYLQSAYALQDGLHEAMRLCDQAKWPFYSILIAGVVQLTHFSYVNAAYALNGLFSLLTILAFIAVIHCVSKQKNNQALIQKDQQTSLLWLAAIVILFANEFNSIKQYVIRDHGFWAFYLLSILFLLNFVQYPRLRYAIGWSISMIVATLFRIEGAIFLLAMPFFACIALDKNYLSRAKAFLTLNAITLFLSCGLVCWFLFNPEPSAGRLGELQFQLSHGYTTLLHHFIMRSDQLGHAILNVYSMRDAELILLLTLIAWYFVIAITNLSWVYALLVAMAWWKKSLKAHQSTKIIWAGYVLINIAITFIFLSQNMFLSKRYLVALSLALMLWVPFILNDLLQKWPRQKWPIVLAVTSILLFSLGGIFDFGHSKNYIYDAGTWLAKNTKPDAKIYSNDLLVMYYSNHFGNHVFKEAKRFKHFNKTNDSSLEKFDYVALRLDKDKLDKTGMLALMDSSPVQVFANKRGDQVQVYKK